MADTVIVTTVGTSTYSPTSYQFDKDTVIEASEGFFVTCLAKYLQATNVIALLTKDAEDYQWEGLSKSLAKVKGLTPEIVRIPNGSTEADMWHMFDLIAEAIPEGSKLVLDITHGFRSLPTMMLTAASYLEKIHNVEIIGVYYGVFDRLIPVSTVVNIGPFMTLLDWNNAVDAFKRTGECRLLADLLRQTQTTLQTNRQTDNTTLPTKLKSVAGKLEELSLALDLIRPDDVFISAFKLQRELQEAEAEFPQWAKPFNLLLESVRNEFVPLSLEHPRSEASLDNYLDCQWLLIKWYRKKKRYYGAILLAREWVISWYMRHSGKSIDQVLDEIERDAAEKELNQIWYDKSWSADSMKNVSQAFHDIAFIRNDLAHIGMRKQPMPSDKLQKNIDSQIDKLSVATGQHP